MPYCPKCGSEIGEDDEYCMECGEELTGRSEGEQPQGKGQVQANQREPPQKRQEPPRGQQQYQQFTSDNSQQSNGEIEKEKELYRQTKDKFIIVAIVSAASFIAGAVLSKILPYSMPFTAYLGIVALFFIVGLFFLMITVSYYNKVQKKKVKLRKYGISEEEL